MSSYNPITAKKYREANREHRRLQSKEWHLKNKDRELAYRKKYYSENKEKMNLYKNAYRQTEKGKLAHRKQEQERYYKTNYYEKNKDRILARGKEWRLDNKHLCLAQSARRRLRNKLAGGLSKEIIQMVYEDNIKKYGTLTCCLCFERIEFGQDSLEHLMPLIRGGNNDYNNLGVAHLTCNLRKNKKTVEEWEAINAKG